MKWFDKWFAKKCKYVWENHNQLVQNDSPDNILAYKAAQAPISARQSHPNKGYVDFKLWFADNGGYLIEFNKYDERKDRYNNELFIVQDGIENLGQEITQILTQHVISNR